jgi:hypothetical protein
LSQTKEKTVVVIAATTLRQVETPPSSYPATPSGLSTKAAALAPALVWDRIEAWISYRWTARQVVWTVDGPGEWHPPLVPAVISTIERWDETLVWIADTLDASPFDGYQLRDWHCHYRFTATVGGGSPAVPAALPEAYRRLAEYFAQAPHDDDEPAGSTNFRIILAQREIEIEYQRSQSWLARCIHNSGAGDLLRPYRRAQ